MRKGRIRIVLTAVSAVLAAVFFLSLVKQKKVLLNRMFIKNSDVIGVDVAGAYHFFSFDSPGATQAENFINAVGDLHNDLIPVVDVEFYGDKNENPPAKEDVQRELKVYLDILEERYGVKPMIYCARPIWDSYIKSAFDAYPLWVRSVYYPAWFEFGNKWTVWQYQDTGILDGYSGYEKYIDLNVLNRNVSLEDIMVKQ